MITAELAKPGTRVSYEDRANPRRVGTIIEVLTKCPPCAGTGIVRRYGHPRAGEVCVLCGGTGDRATGTEYRIVWDADGLGEPSCVSDCRQHGWNLTAGDSWNGTPFEGADIIAVYTRAQAIEDGELVDVTPAAHEVGFRWPVAMTRPAWSETVEWEHGGLQDERGRLHDVVWMLFCAVRAGGSGDRIEYELLRVPNDAGATKPSLVSLVGHVGPGDDGEPVITIMLPGEN